MFSAARHSPRRASRWPYAATVLLGNARDMLQGSSQHDDSIAMMQAVYRGRHLRHSERIAQLDKASEQVQATPQHGLSSKKMAPITSDYGIMRSLSIKWL